MATLLGSLRSNLGSLPGVLAATVGVSLGGCAAAPPMARMEIPVTVKAGLSLDRGATLRQLDELEAQLVDFENLRVAKLEQYGFLLVIPAIYNRYAKALEHHRTLSAEVCERKERVLTCGSDEELSTINHWCEENHRALCSLRELATYAERHNCIPAGWSAPPGFEYLGIGPQAGRLVAKSNK